MWGIREAMVAWAMMLVAGGFAAGIGFIGLCWFGWWLFRHLHWAWT